MCVIEQWEWEERPETNDWDQPIDGIVQYHADFEEFWYIVSCDRRGWRFFSETENNKRRFNTAEEAMRAAEKREAALQARFERREAFYERIRDTEWPVDDISDATMNRITAVLVAEGIWTDKHSDSNGRRR